MKTKDIKRIYKNELFPEFDDEIYTLKEWENMIRLGVVWNDCGSGYWVKDNLASRDEVFHTPQLDATHVVWYSK